MAHVVVVVEHVAPPGLAVATYPVMALPPSEAGAVHDSVTLALDAAAVIEVGAPGVVAGVAEDAADGMLVPVWLRAVTVIEYVVPFASPVTAHDVAVVAHDDPPGLAVAV
jgi:hypothetical protein